MVRVLWYNWKDIKHPAAGGAEVYTHEIGKRLVKRGHEVILFCSQFNGGSQEEVIDGIKIVRKAGKYGVYGAAKEFYESNKSNVDVIVDEINTRPFLTPRFVKTKRTVAIIHQLAREFWFSETPFPVALLGYFFLEKMWLKNYIDVPTITVSKSTQNDLVELGFSNTMIVPNGVNIKPLDRLPEKVASPTIIFVGRMRKAKRPQDVLTAFKIVKEQVPTAKVWMVGDGYLSDHLRRSNPDARFFGRVEANLRDELVKRAWLIAVPGTREGWGQVVSDSNALGTPAVGYRIPGLIDSIIDGHNGLLVDPEPESMASSMINLLTNEQARDSLSKNALEWSRQFDWDNSTRIFEKNLA